MSERKFTDINNDYNKLAAIVGDFFIKNVFDNPDMLKKYKEFLQLKKEAEEIGEKNKQAQADLAEEAK